MKRLNDAQANNGVNKYAGTWGSINISREKFRTVIVEVKTESVNFHARHKQQDLTFPWKIILWMTLYTLYERLCFYNKIMSYSWFIQSWRVSCFTLKPYYYYSWHLASNNLWNTVFSLNVIRTVFLEAIEIFIILRNI